MRSPARPRPRSPRRRPVVVLGFPGSATVALGQQPDLRIDRLELVVPKDGGRLVDSVSAELARVAPATAVRRLALDVVDPRDFEEVFAALHALARAYPFRPDDEDYFVHLTPAPPAAQVALVLLTSARWFPAKLLQTSAAPRGERSPRRPHGDWSVVDVDLARSDRLAPRGASDHGDARAVLTSGLPTRSEAFGALLDRLARVAVVTRAPLVLVGPPGSGKTQLARRVHALRAARGLAAGPLVEVACGALRGDDLRDDVLGKARGGVVLLDEVGELGRDDQAALLRSLDVAGAGDGRNGPAEQGGPREVQLVATTRRDLEREVAHGRFRDDLLARLGVWTFRVPGLDQRREDLELLLDHALERAGAALSVRVTLAGDARAAYLAWATSDEAVWPAGFHDLGASALRLATLAPGGNVDLDTVREELATLRASFAARRDPGDDDGAAPSPARPARPDLVPADAAARVLGPARADALDRFDRVQLSDVLEVCARARSLSDAGRTLFAASRRTKTSANDADRLRKYLARHELDLDLVRARLAPG